jgi:Flp pilus assembly pilin Flp
MGNSKGQNVIEYVLLVAAVVIVCVYFISSGPMRQTLNATLNSMVNEVKNLNSQIKF